MPENKFIVGSVATSQMVNLKKNMTNHKDAEARVAVGDSRTLTGTKCGDWHRYQKRDGKLHHVTLSDTAIIPGRHTNIFSMTLSLKKGFQVTSEGEALILKKNSTDIQFDKKWRNMSAKDSF